MAETLRYILFRAFAVILIIDVQAAASQAWAAPDPDEAKHFVRTGFEQVIEILEEDGLTEDERIDRLRGLLRRDFDIATVGRFALGAHGRKVSEAKLREYLQAFEEHVVDAYVARLVRLVDPDLVRAAADSIQILGTRPAGTHDIYVRMGVERSGKKPLEVEWRVRETKNRLKIIDVYFLGVSLALTYRQEFSSVIIKRGKGIDGLIAALREHATIHVSQP